MPKISVTYNDEEKMYQAVAEGYEYIVVLADSREQAERELREVLQNHVLGSTGRTTTIQGRRHA